MKKLFFAAMLVTNIATAQKIPLPDVKLKASTICGLCKPGQLGDPLLFTKKPYSPDIDDNSTEKAIAYSILGHTYPAEENIGDVTNTCSESSNNPFSISDIKPLGSLGRSIDYKRSEKLNINIKLAVQANMNELKKFTTDTAKLLKIEATIKASYAKINNKDLTVIGTYSEWGISKDVIEKLTKNSGFAECKAFMNDHNYKFITAVGLIKFDISFEQNSLDAIATAVQSEVERQGITANISFTFKKEVSQTLKTATANLYQVVVWRAAPPSYFNL